MKSNEDNKAIIIRNVPESLRKALKIKAMKKAYESIMADIIAKTKEAIAQATK